AHGHLVAVARDAWLARLDEVARAAVGPVPALAEALAAHAGAQWLVIDALGLPLLDTLLAALPDLLPAWRLLATPAFAAVAPPTTTAAWAQDLAATGVAHAFAKIDAVDRLLHERFVPFADLG